MSEIDDKTTNITNASTLIASLLSDPNAISKIGDIISKYTKEANSNSSPLYSENLDQEGEMSANNNNNFETFESNSPTFNNLDLHSIISKLPDILSKISSIKEEDSLVSKQQIALLSAIRPYLSSRRKELIDAFIKMNHLGAIFKNLS